MKLGGLLKSLAPTIANAAGGPLAGMAVKIAASKLGLPSTATANEIEDLIEREPDKAVSLKLADNEFKDRIKCEATDVQFVLSQNSDNGQDLSKLQKCLKEICPGS